MWQRMLPGYLHPGETDIRGTETRALELLSRKLEDRTPGACKKSNLKCIKEARKRWAMTRYSFLRSQSSTCVTKLPYFFSLSFYTVLHLGIWVFSVLNQ